MLERDPGSVVAEPELRGQPGVVEGADEVVVALAEVSPAVIVDRDDHGRPQDRGRRGRLDAVQAQRPVPELARDTGGAGVQDDRLDGRDAPGDLGDGPDRGVVPADVDAGQVRPGQDEADDLAVDEAVDVTIAVVGTVYGGDRRHGQLAAVGTAHGMAGPGIQTDGRLAEAAGSAAGGQHQRGGQGQGAATIVQVIGVVVVADQHQVHRPELVA